MEFDYSRLKGRIVERFGSSRAFAAAWGVSENCVSNKLNNKSRFSAQDITKLCSDEMLSIKPEEIGSFFYTLKVR